jgi:hypothetical protein
MEEDIGERIIEKLGELNIRIEGMANKIKKLEEEKNGKKLTSPSLN